MMEKGEKKGCRKEGRQEEKEGWQDEEEEG